MCHIRTRGDSGSFSRCLHPGNGPNGTHFALEELSGNPLRRALSGAHEAQRDAASGHPFSCERPAAFRARLPGAPHRWSRGACSLGQKRGTGLRHGHGDPTRVRAPGPTVAGKGSGGIHDSDVLLVLQPSGEAQVVMGWLYGEMGYRRRRGRKRLPLQVGPERG